MDKSIMGMNKVRLKEKTLGKYILDEFDDVLTYEVKERIYKLDNEIAIDDYMFIFYHTREKALFSLQNLLWEDFLRACPNHGDLPAVLTINSNRNVNY